MSDETPNPSQDVGGQAESGRPARAEIRPGVRRLFRLGLRRRDLTDHDADEEVRLHLALRTDALVRRGMPPEAARAEAVRRFGSVDEAHVQLHRSAARRDARLAVGDWLNNRWDDLRYSLRSLRRTPGLTTALFLTLALGVGANAAVFGVLDQLMFRPPAGVVEPSGIQRLYARNVSAALGWEGEGRVTASVRWRDLVELTDAARGTAQVVGDHSRGAQLTVDSASSGDDASPALHVSFVSPGYFSFLGVRPQLGRFFAPDEEKLDNPAPVV